MPHMSEIEVEIVFAAPDRQLLQMLRVEAGATVDDVIGASGIRASFPEQNLDELTLGIWGKEVAGDRVLVAGDRIEIYRPLNLDPREARRRLALSGHTMGGTESA